MQSSFKVRHTVLGRGISERIDGVEEAGCGTEGRFGSASWVLRSLSSRAVVWLTSHRPRHLPRVNLTERDEQPLTRNTKDLPLLRGPLTSTYHPECGPSTSIHPQSSARSRNFIRSRSDTVLLRQSPRTFVEECVMN